MSSFRFLCLRYILVRWRRTRDGSSRWMPCGRLIIRHLPSTAKHVFLCLLLRREHGHPPRRSPGPPVMGAARTKCLSQSLSCQTGSSHNLLVMLINDPSGPWLDQTSMCWPLGEHNDAEVFTVSVLFKTDDPSLWSGLLSPSARAAAFRENRGLCINCHEENNSFRHCRHSFINASGCLNPELGQLDHDDAYRRWQSRMTSYRRGDKSSRPNNQQPREKSTPSFRSIERVPPGPGPGKQSQQQHIDVGPPWWHPAVARLICPQSYS